MSGIDPEDIVRALNVPYTKQGVWIWLSSPNRNLGNERPVDLLANGKTERVIREIERIDPCWGPAEPAAPTHVTESDDVKES